MTNTSFPPPLLLLTPFSSLAMFILRSIRLYVMCSRRRSKDRNGLWLNRTVAMLRLSAQQNIGILSYNIVMELYHIEHASVILYVRVHMRLVKVCITHDPSIIFKRNLHQSIYFTKSKKLLEARGCKPWVTNLSIIPHTLGVLTTNIAYK